MTKFSWCLLLACFVFSGCLKQDKGCPYKDSTVIATTAEQQQVEAYLSTNGITNAVKHSSGMYYTIITPGTGNKPGLCSVVSVGYTGTLTTGAVFDQQNIISFDLGRLIDGWKKGLPLVAKGGRIKLFIPPSLGYGNTDVKNSSGVVVIPANSMLIFDIEVFDVN